MSNWCCCFALSARASARSDTSFISCHMVTKWETNTIIDHAHATLSNASNASVVASVVVNAESSKTSKDKTSSAISKFAGSHRGQVPSFAEWKRNHYDPNSSLAASRLGVVTPNAGDRRKGSLLNSDGISPFHKNRPRTTPMKSRPRTPLEYAMQRSWYSCMQA